jgi:hypothetical protein
MPPIPTWFVGREAVARFLALRLPASGRVRMVRADANGQPGPALYHETPDGNWRAHALHVLAISPSGIERIVAYMDPGIFSLFGLPQTDPAIGRTALPRAGLGGASRLTITAGSVSLSRPLAAGCSSQQARRPAFASVRLLLSVRVCRLSVNRGQIAGTVTSAG